MFSTNGWRLLAGSCTKSKPSVSLESDGQFGVLGDIIAKHNTIRDNSVVAAALTNPINQLFDSVRPDKCRIQLTNPISSVVRFCAPSCRTQLTNPTVQFSCLILRTQLPGMCFRTKLLWSGLQTGLGGTREAITIKSMPL